MFVPRQPTRCDAGGGPSDFGGLVDELRCHTTEWLSAQRQEAVREQRRWRLRELALTRVLDERGAIDDSLAQADGVAIRTVRETIETARALEALPEIASVAAAGGLSCDQLTAVVKVAEPESDGEWAHRAQHASPQDLRQAARLKEKPTAADGLARRAARRMHLWWQRDIGMVGYQGQLPDVDGAFVESVLNHMVDRMKPAKGQPWETRARRMADAFVELCRNYADVNAVATPTPHFVVEVPLEGPATIAGIPLPDGMVESLRAQAKVEAILVDADGAPVASGRTTGVVPPKVVRAIRLRDGKCRWPGCDRRTGLQVHHLWPASWGGPDAQWNLACVCVGGGTDHHAQLAPQGRILLLGNPNDPAGLVLVDRDDRIRIDELVGSRSRAGPAAA